MGQTDLARVVQTLDNAIDQINHYPVDSLVCYVYTLESAFLSSGQCYPDCEQQGPGS